MHKDQQAVSAARSPRCWREETAAAAAGSKDQGPKTRVIRQEVIDSDKATAHCHES